MPDLSHLNPAGRSFTGPATAGVTVKIDGVELRFLTRADGTPGYELTLAVPSTPRQTAELHPDDAGRPQSVGLDDPETFQSDCAALQMALRESPGRRLLKPWYAMLCVSRSWPTVDELERRYGTWSKALHRCGVPLPRRREVPVEECTEAFMTVAEYLGYGPSEEEYDALRPKGAPCAATVKARYGGQWPTV